jgi:hypothetical protein
MYKSFKGLGVTIFLLLGFCGCEQPILVEPIPPGVEGAKFEDIPIPAGFQQDKFLTYGHIYPKFKVYTLVYRGKRTAKGTADFYKSAMPKSGWTLSKEDGRDAIRLVFIKDIEKCEIFIKQISQDLTEIKIERGLK